VLPAARIAPAEGTVVALSWAHADLHLMDEPVMTMAAVPPRVYLPAILPGQRRRGGCTVGPVLAAAEIPADADAERRRCCGSGIIYLGSLLALLLQSFFSIDEYSGLISGSSR